MSSEAPRDPATAGPPPAVGDLEAPAPAEVAVAPPPAVPRPSIPRPSSPPGPRRTPTFTDNMATTVERPGPAPMRRSPTLTDGVATAVERPSNPPPPRPSAPPPPAPAVQAERSSAPPAVPEAPAVPRPASEGSEGPPAIPRLFSPVPAPPRPAAPSPAAPPAADAAAQRRKSRRTVKIPDDAVPNTTPAPPAVALDRASPEPAERLSPEPAERVSPAPAVDDGEVIRPMRIISIGSIPPPGEPVRPPVLDERPLANPSPPRPISRPPVLASPAIEAFIAPPPPVPTIARPPVDVEEVEAVEEVEPDAPASPPQGVKVDAVEPEPRAARTDEIEPLEEIEPEPRAARTDEIEPLEEIEPERISDVDNGAKPADAAAPDSKAEGEAPKKKPPPPPKRQGAPISIEPPPSPASPPPASPAAAAPAATAPAAAAPPAAPAPAAAPPAAPAAAPAVAAPPAETTATRKRQRAWWEELFGDDFLRTMDRLEPKVIRRECDFIEDRLGLEKGAVILDLACGPGVHAVELSSRGYSVVGYDLSLAMLARAADEAQDRGQKINFLHGDMREMAFEETFDGVYSWSTSFGYFDDEKNLNVLHRVHRALRKGGLFLLDIINRDYVAPRQPSLVWFEGEGCVCMDEMAVDFFSSRLKVKRTVMFEDGRTRECDYAIRLYALHEIGKMLHECGFKVAEVTGHPAHPGVFFGSESPRLIVLAERS